jgi:hypothetical protein
VTRIATDDRGVLRHWIVMLPDWPMGQVDAGLLRALALDA